MISVSKSFTITIAIASLFITSNTFAHDDWGGHVVTLTDTNFDKKVLDSDDVWLVNFYAPWCPHCKNLQPIYEEASRAIKKSGLKNVKLGAIDASQYQSYAQKYGIKGFPTLKFFPAGQKTENDAKDYNEGRTAKDILAWAKSMSAEIKPPPEVLQMTSEKILKESCGSAQLCVISVLPQLFDCQSDCRNRYIDRLKSVAETFKSKQWAYLWVEANAQPDLEKALDIGGFGYPALAAVNIRKMAYSLMRGSFSTEGITDFLKELSYGQGKSAPIKGAKMPEIKKTPKWDGQDMELPKFDDEL